MAQDTCGCRKRKGVQDRQAFDVLSTPQFMPVEVCRPVFDLLRACRLRHDLAALYSTGPPRSKRHASNRILNNNPHRTLWRFKIARPRHQTHLICQQSLTLGMAGLLSPVLVVDLAFSFRRSILRAAFFCCFSFRAQAFCLFLNVSIFPPRSLSH